MINYLEKLKHEYDMIWDGYLENTDHREMRRDREKGRKVYYDLIRKYIYHFANLKLLELGSGTGIDISVVSEDNESIEAFASDISEKSIRVGLKVASEFQNKIKFFVCDTLRLPLKDNTIHVIFSQGLVEHFRDPLAVITEQKRVLKKTGILIVNVPQKYTGYTLEKKRLMRSGKWQLGWESEFSYRDLMQIGKTLGLIEKEVRGYQYWKSWREPVFVLKDLYDKFHRRNPIRSFWPFPALKKGYDSIWEQLETKWGHYFLQNIVIVFQKKANEDTSC